MTGSTKVSEGAKVTNAELFLDLVFVYGFTQVTALMAHHLSWGYVVQAMLVLALLWWYWTGFAWLGNAVQADEGPVRIVLFVVMAVVFIIDITIPEAFEDHKGGLFGPWVFAACYLAMRLIHSGAMLYASRAVPHMRRNSLLFSIPGLVGAAILFYAGTTTGTVQIWLWVAVIAIEYGSVFIIRAEGWALSAASHFAERHGLIIIIALGESIVSIGVGISDLPTSWDFIMGSVLGIAVVVAIWWAYFDVTALMAERALHHAAPALRSRLARDAYTMLHLPMVAGIILFSLGLKKVLQHLHHPLPTLGLLALYGGVVLFLLAHTAFKFRLIGKIGPHRLAGAALLLALIYPMRTVSALVALAVLAAVMVSLVSYEVFRYRDLRQQVRHA